MTILGNEKAIFTKIDTLSQNPNINFSENFDQSLCSFTNRICLEHTGVDTLML